MTKHSKKSTETLSTKAIHAAERRVEGAVSFPIFQTAMFKAAGETSYDDVKYIRLNNLPNQQVLGEKLAAMENAETGQMFASGMAAIVTTLLTLLESGDHLLAHKSLYGGTYDFVLRDLPRFGIETTFVDACDPATWQKALRPETRVFYVESITNPMTEVADFRQVVEFARENGLVSVIDSTFTTPCNFRPVDVGFDVVVHSASKYLAGHSDLVAGAAAGNTKMMDRIRHLANHLGGCLDPHACFLLHRSLKTLPLRMERHNGNAMKIASFLERHPAVERVYYPGLESHPNHAAAKEYFDGCGGMMSMEMNGGADAARKVVEGTRLFTHASSLGGVESLICRPASMSHLGLSDDELKAAGISPSLIRLSVGLEDAGDLAADLKQAIQAATKS